MRHTKMVEPGAVVKTNGIDDERISFPLAGRYSIKGRIRIFGKRASIGPNRPVGMRPLKKLKDSVLRWNEFHSIDADLKKDIPYQSQWVAIPCRIVS